MRLRRRELLILAGLSSGAVWLGSSRGLHAQDADREAPAGEALPRCILTPEQTEGPYFVDERLERADIRSDPFDGSVSEGIPLQLGFRVRGVTNDGCAPLAGAIVDLWHCDARGIYSGVRDPSFRTTERGFLRGYQRTDASGAVTFETIYPGWYPGRAVHVHFKVRTERGRSASEVTSQLYFDEGVTQQVFSRPPYAARGPAPSNRRDGIYRYGGELLTLVPTPRRSGERSGYRATFDVGLALT